MPSIRAVPASATVGFLGLGAMGGAIVARLLAHSRQLVVFDIDPFAVERVGHQGAIIAESAAEVAERAEVVFVCLPSPDVSRESIFGGSGLVHGGSLSTVIELSTVGSPCVVEFATRLAERSIGFLDAPVSGSARAVAANELAIMVAGPQACFEKHEELLRVFASRVFHVSERPGSAQLCKLINNFIAIAGLAAACEGLALALREGVAPGAVIEIVNAGSGRNWATDTLLPASVLVSRFEGTGPIRIGLKDLDLYLQEGERLQAITPLGGRLEALWRTIVESGDPGRDTTELLHYFTDTAKARSTADSGL